MFVTFLETVQCFSCMSQYKIYIYLNCIFEPSNSALNNVCFAKRGRCRWHLGALSFAQYSEYPARICASGVRQLHLWQSVSQSVSHCPSIILKYLSNRSLRCIGTSSTCRNGSILVSVYLTKSKRLFFSVISIDYRSQAVTLHALRPTHYFQRLSFSRFHFTHTALRQTS